MHTVAFVVKQRNKRHAPETKLLAQAPTALPCV